MTTFAVRDYGAVGDGKSKDTAAIQQAIDACTAAGGGTVSVSPGVYLTGTVVLKDNVTLCVGAGATLLASPDRADYDTSRNLPGDVPVDFERVGNEHLIFAVNARNIALTGDGLIDGNAPAFMDMKTPWLESVGPWRPSQMICLCGCQNVTIRDLRFRNPSYWTIRPWGCTSVLIHGIRIDNDPMIPNGDGIDIDCCRDVVVSDCIVNASDDCITLRARAIDGLERADCENVTVTNCVLATRCSGIRIGVGNGTIRNATFSNLVINPRGPHAHGIDFMPWKRPVRPGAALPDADPVTENIRFSNIEMDMPQPLRLWAGEEEGEHRGVLRNVSFSGMRLRGSRCSLLDGRPNCPIQDVTFTDVTWRICGAIADDQRLDELPFPTPRYGLNHKTRAPHAVYARHIRGLQMRDVRITWDEAATGWRSALCLDQCDDVTLRNVQADPGQLPDATALHTRQVTGLRCLDCNLDPPAE